MAQDHQVSEAIYFDKKTQQQILEPVLNNYML